MANFNKVLLMGNLTRDPELRFTSNGSALAKFGLAVSRKYKAGEEWKEEVCFVDITVWGKQAEQCRDYLAKGRSVYIEGRLQTRDWEDRDGNKRQTTEVVAQRVQFLDSRGGGGPAGSGPGGGGPGGGTGQGGDGPPEDDPGLTDEDIPL